MRTPRAALIAAALLGAALARASEERSAFLTLSINTVDRGEVMVMLREDDVLVPRAALEEGGVRSGAGETVRVGDKPFVSLASLAPDVKYQVDDRALTLRITAKPQLLDRSVFDLRQHAPPDLVYRRDTSGFLNYSLRLGDLHWLDGFAEAALSVRGALLYSSVSLSSSRTWVPVRGQTNLTIDERGALRRWIVGDTFASTGALGGGTFLGGLTVARSFDIDPYYVQQPMLGYAGAALTPSTLEVYVNDVLVKRESLAPGPFQVQNVPVTVGSGTTRYVLRDALGHETDVNGRYYLPANLLAKGVDDYSYSLGFRRDRVATDSFGYGAFAALARHRRGLTDWLTVGLRLECAIDLLSGGADLVFRTPAGPIELAAAGSVESGSQQGTGGYGASGMLSYAFLSRVFSASVRATAATARYATLSTRAEDDRAYVEVAANAAVP